MTKLTAKVVPFSSVTGGGIALHDEAGAVVGQLRLSGVGSWPVPNTAAQREAFMAEYAAMCERIAAAINAGQPERNIRHLKKGQIYDVMAERALFQVSTPGLSLTGKQRLTSDGDPVTVYRNPELGMTFVRFPDEIEDPARFEEVQL